MNTPFKNTTKLTLGLALGAVISTSALAQSGSLRSAHPDLATLYNAFDVTQAGIYDAIADINGSPDAQEGRMELKMHLDMLAEAEQGGHGGHGGMGMAMEMDMDGHFGELETDARIDLGESVRGTHSDSAAGEAFANSEALTTHAAMVLAHGRSFENALWDIFANDSTSQYQKQTAVNEAIHEYLTSDERHAVSTSPKAAELYLDHPYADAFRMGYPKLSGLMYSNQWLQLASLEAIIIGQVDPQFAGRVPVTLERYWNKVGSDTGMTMFPAPTEMPSVPAISPQLYSQSPMAAVIIDNLNMLESALADVIAYPNLQDRETVIDQVVEQYTADDLYVADTMDYLLNALRGGIFNQGGPAIGDLSRSERNRSRDAMGMNHVMIMSNPN
ncbi:MAG: hypothetical protein GKR91_08220 [Pseudomonadales bacterium]|nr:hypothetical protein [Pseudomonadales bacterium]